MSERPEAIPAPVPAGDGAPALPEGLEPLPEWGPDAVGTLFREGALTFYRGLSITLMVLAAATLVLSVPAFTESVIASLVVLVLLGLLVASAVNYHRIAGHVRPAVVVTGTTLEVLVPFNRFTVELAAVRDVTVLSRDLIVLAPGGIRHGGRPSRARRAVINNVRSFAVERAALAKVIEERVREARR